MKRGYLLYTQFGEKDVCDILDITNSRDAISRLDEDEKLMLPLLTSGQNRNTWFINESGLYSLILTSRKPEAKQKAISRLDEDESGVLEVPHPQKS